MSINILLLPIDNRPVCYQLPLDITSVSDSINLTLPPKELLGGLRTSAKYEEILSWCENTLSKEKFHYIIISLDTIAYGGLVASRRIEITQAEIESRINTISRLFSKQNAKIFATSSIMRISNNNINEEEKDYWNSWGKKIFEYSYLYHCNGAPPAHDIPKHILEDYLSTRHRNYNANLFYLELLEKRLFDKLIFSKDDTAQFGLNIEESQSLEKIIKEKGLNALIKTGADEIPLALISAAVVDYYQEDIHITPSFSNPDAKKIISRYEDISIEESTLSQISLCGAKTAINEGDISLFINTPNKIQDDLALAIFNDTKNKTLIPPDDKPFAIADIALANGSDNKLIKKLLSTKTSKNLLSYAGWNTTANTLGCAISIAIINFISQKNKCFNQENYRKLLTTRLLDDWAYQANIRQELRENKYLELEQAFEPYAKKIESFIGHPTNKFKAKLPWERSFEVEICFRDNEKKF